MDYALKQLLENQAIIIKKLGNIDNRLEKTATKESIANLDIEIRVLNNTIFEQEGRMLAFLRSRELAKSRE